MKRFRFPLRSVAVIRAHAEFLARVALAVAVRACAEAEAELANRRARLARVGEDLFASRAGRFNAAEAVAQFRVYQAECIATMTAETALNASRAAKHQCQQDYLEAHRQLQNMEHAEVRARTVHFAESLRSEQAELDEIAGHRTRRSRLCP